MLYIVTGANGHLGLNLIKKLLLEKQTVRALVLPKDDIERLNNLDVDIYFGDVTDKESLLPLFDLNDTSYTYNEVIVVHTAGIISISNKHNKMMEYVNVVGTKNMLDLSIALGAKQFIYTSSVHAIPEKNKGELTVESNIFDPNLVEGAYAKSKAIATKLVFDAYEDGYPVTIVHPSGIIGPNDYNHGHMTQMIEKYLNKQLSTRTTGGYDFVDVRDVSDGIYELSLGHHLGAYILSGEYVSLKKLFEVLKKISGRKRKTAVLANWFVKLFTPMLESYYARKKEPPLFTSYSLYTLKSNSNFSHEKASNVINYKPRNIYDTILDTALWLIDEKRLNKNKVVSFIKKILRLK